MRTWLQGYKLYRVGMMIMLLISIILGVALFNRQKVTHEILATGGNAYYTKQINVLSEEALDNLNYGKKEIYIFPEWGFMSGFNYQTNNMIAFSTNCDKDSINQYIDEGYDICILAWEMNKNVDEYRMLLSDSDCREVVTREYNSRCKRLIKRCYFGEKENKEKMGKVL